MCHFCSSLDIARMCSLVTLFLNVSSALLEGPGVSIGHRERGRSPAVWCASMLCRKHAITEMKKLGCLVHSTICLGGGKSQESKRLLSCMDP